MLRLSDPLLLSTICCLSSCLYVCRSVWKDASVYLSICCLSICLLSCLSLSVYLSLSDCRSICLFGYMPLSICLSFCQCQEQIAHCCTCRLCFFCCSCSPSSCFSSSPICSCFSSLTACNFFTSVALSDLSPLMSLLCLALVSLTDSSCEACVLDNCSSCRT